jgi:hypothetical protein
MNTDSSDRMEPTAKVYTKLVCVLCLWALWKATANMAFCYLFWITALAWVVRYIVHAKAIGGLFILLGITSNALVTLLNEGVMPSVGIPSTFQPASPIWSVSGKGRWLALGDQAALYRFSIGDIFLIAGLLLFVMWKVYRLIIITPIKEGSIVELRLFPVTQLSRPEKIRGLGGHRWEREASPD